MEGTHKTKDTESVRFCRDLNSYKTYWEILITNIKNEVRKKCVDFLSTQNRDHYGDHSKVSPMNGMGNRDFSGVIQMIMVHRK